MEKPIPNEYPILQRTPLESVESRIYSAMQDLGFCFTDWTGADEEMTFEPLSFPWTPKIDRPSYHDMPTGDEFLRLLRLHNRLSYYTNRTTSETRFTPACQRLSLEEFFDPFTSTYCDQQYHFIQLQDTLIDIFSARHVCCYHLTFGSQEIYYIMGYYKPNTKDQQESWLVGLKTCTTPL
ncbi:hypothetical protein NQZ79_g725 [Umbelopsis isabellina]|nr:hypothetical protein NQZ79_g725 [Umbelopsis isabellina]